MGISDHVRSGLLIRLLDDELSLAQRISVEEHLASCEECRTAFRELGALSVHVERLAATMASPVPVDARLRLEAALHGPAARRVPRKPLFWPLAVGAAAAALVGVVFIPARQHPKAAARPTVATTFEIEGETFVTLPYSNPYLPASGSRIVEMRVPVATLGEAGLILDAASENLVSRDSVLADVVLGVDGEPIGIHVLSEL